MDVKVSIADHGQNRSEMTTTTEMDSNCASNVASVRAYNAPMVFVEIQEFYQQD